MTCSSTPPSPALPGAPSATPAGAVAVVRDGRDGQEVLLARRSGSGTFAGAWVLPGGQVEADDREGGASPAEVAARAAARELAEETGIVIGPHALVRLCGPLIAVDGARRFEVWFFAAPCPLGVHVRLDGIELLSFRWVSATRLPPTDEAGLIPPATRTALAALAHQLAASGEAGR